MGVACSQQTLKKEGHIPKQTAQSRNSKIEKLGLYDQTWKLYNWEYFFNNTQQETY